MTREDLIYQMTKAVYERLGPQTDPGLVEDLVTDVVRLIERDRRLEETKGSVSPGARIVVSAFGTSRPGIVAAVSSILAESRYNIVDMNQTVVQGKFAMVLIAEAADSSNDLTRLKEKLDAEGERVGVRIYTQREDLFQRMHRV